jgi:hypothetical protein
VARAQASRQVANAREPPYRFPRFACSRSIASNSALKLPTPKPRDYAAALLALVADLAGKYSRGHVWFGAAA